MSEQTDKTKHTHHHRRKNNRMHLEDRMRMRNLTWRKVKKISARVLFIILSTVALCVVLYGLYLWLFEPAEQIKEVTPL